MRLDEMLELRAVPAAGLYLTVTRRCPLACAHCSTQSLMTSEQHPEDIFRRFVETFRVDDRPEIVYITGGEALLRPKLVRALTERCHGVGARVALISGMFFARRPEIPAPLRRAIAEVDHFTASLDIFHEQQVPRAEVFRVLGELADAGKELSIQITCRDNRDPYLGDVTADVERTFGNRVGVLVGYLSPVGRAREWLPPSDLVRPNEVAPLPCPVAAWPVVAYDGTVVACCSEEVVAGPAPAHLRLGHAGVDEWPTIRERLQTRTMLRAIRLWGPEYLANRYGSEKPACDGYCETCYKLSDDPALAQRLEPIIARPTTPFIEGQVLSMQRDTWRRRGGDRQGAQRAEAGVA